MSFTVWMKFHLLKLMHRRLAKRAHTLSADDRYWQETFLAKP